MVTFLIICDQSTGLMIRTGYGFGTTYSLNNAKHFTSDVKAWAYMRRYNLRFPWIIKKIRRY